MVELGRDTFEAAEHAADHRTEVVVDAAAVAVGCEADTSAVVSVEFGSDIAADTAAATLRLQAMLHNRDEP